MTGIKSLLSAWLLRSSDNRSVSATYTEELNELCRIFVNVYAAICSVCWLPYLLIDFTLSANALPIAFFRVGLTVVALGSFLAVQWWQHPRRFLIVGIVAVYYIMIATGIITGLAQAHPSYLGGFCFIIVVLTPSPVPLRHLYTALVLSIAAFAGLCWYYHIPLLTPAPALRYSLQDFGSAIVCCFGLAFVFDHWKHRFWEQSHALQRSNDELRSQQHELERQAVELHDAKQRADDADTLRTEFVSNISHEIRTPLTFIRGFAEVLSYQIPEHQHVYIQRILHGAEQLETLFNDLLQISQSQIGQVVVEQLPIRTKAFFERIVAMFQVAVQDKGLTSSLHISPETPTELMIDEPKVRQMIFNVIGNAVKFTEHGSVEVIVEADETLAQHRAGLLIVTVRDTGIGMDEETLRTLFEMFRQHDGSSTRKFGGLGLGLAVCKRLADAIGATIHVESRLQHGSTLRIEIPTQTP
jgi:signal transduction histidine kinase